jgi:hypothetical protein
MNRGVGTVPQPGVRLKRSSLRSTDAPDEKALVVAHNAQPTTTASGFQNKARYLVVSPYTEQGHCLDLQTLDPECQLLALSLARLRCVREDYATSPYLHAFNWDEVMVNLRAKTAQRGHGWSETSFFIVVFRSTIISPTTDYAAELEALDKAAHAEATASGGFLK